MAKEQSIDALALENPEWPADPAGYLQAAGWRLLPLAERPARRRCWDDPAARKGPDGEVKIPAAVGRNGRPERQKTQKLVTASGWASTTEEAVLTQMQRDGTAK